MAPAEETQGGGLQSRLRERPHAFRAASRDEPAPSSGTSSAIATGSATAVDSEGSPALTGGVAASEVAASTVVAESQALEPNTVRTTKPRHHRPLPRNMPNEWEFSSRIDEPPLSDVWTAAYWEAVESLDRGVHAAILDRKNVEQLFMQLQVSDEETTDESAFMRGVQYLRSIQVPLEKFKLALDLASPLTAIEPTTSAAFGIIRSVTAIAISVSTVDLEFGKHIGDMLKHISYIDDCDTLGQRDGRKDIHQALVPVYQKLLEFYMYAHGILQKKGIKPAWSVIIEDGTLPSIVKGFSQNAEYLQRLIEKATWQIAGDNKAMLYDEKISYWLGNDKLLQQSRFHADLQHVRDDQACGFLVASTEFERWYRAASSPSLAVLGDVGSGKTMTMSFIIDELCRRRDHQLPRPLICYHYCQDGETASGAYVFSALIQSLLGQLPGLKKDFFEWYTQELSSGNFQPATDRKKLLDYFQKIAANLDRQLILVIDGLDECDEAFRSMLIVSLRILSHGSRGVKVIVSTRPWAEIIRELGGMPTVAIGSSHERDRLIAEKIVETRLSSWTQETAGFIVERLSTLAQGSAVWTKMVVELIADRQIKAVAPMRVFLDNIPQPKQLSKLYTTLFARCGPDDPETQNMAATALEVLAITQRRLSIVELAWAVATGIADQDVTTIAELSELVDCQRIIDLIQPFIASVDIDDLHKRQVALYHQSVKEHILEDWATNRPGLQDGGNFLHPRDKDRVQMISTERLEKSLLDICLRYLLMDEIDENTLFSERQTIIDESPDLANLHDNSGDAGSIDMKGTWETWEENMVRYNPADRGFGEFFVYASCHWFDHYGAVEIGNLPKVETIERVCQANSTRIKNWTAQHSRPDCTLKARFDFDGSLYDPLSITALYGSMYMLHDMLDKSSFSPDMYLDNTATRAVEQILQWGYLSNIAALFMSEAFGPQLRNLDFFVLVMRAHSFCNTDYDRDWEAVFDLVDEILEDLVENRWAGELWSQAARIGCGPVMERLMDAARDDEDIAAEILPPESLDLMLSLANQQGQ